jgi:hypothetical protein
MHAVLSICFILPMEMCSNMVNPLDHFFFTAGYLSAFLAVALGAVAKYNEQFQISNFRSHNLDFGELTFVIWDSSMRT